MNRLSSVVVLILLALCVSWLCCVSLAQLPEPAEPPPRQDVEEGKLILPADYTYLYHLLPNASKRTPDLLTYLGYVREHMRQMLTLVHEVDAIVTQFTRNTSNAPLTTCNYRDTGIDWVGNANRFFEHRRLGSFDSSCVTEAFDSSLQNASLQRSSSDPTAYEPENLFRLINAYGQGLDRISSRLAQLAQPPRWDDPQQAARSNSFQYEDRSQMCTHDFVGFAKVNGKWYINTRITYRDPLLTLGFNERLYINELDGGDLDNFSVQPVTLVKPGAAREPKTESRDFEIWRNDSWVVSRTAFEQQSGAAFASQFGNIFPTDNPAINLALDRGKHSTELAFDATTPSNVAILALPLAMNIVPVALIADVNTFGMLVYTLLTDVLTAVPLAIKGVEVLLIGKRTRYGAVALISGGNLFEVGDELQNKAAEFWVAKCKPEGDFIVAGTSLLVVALFFMVGGIIAEFVAKRWVQRKRQFDMENFVNQQSISQSLLSPQAAALVMSNENARNKRD